MVADAGMRELDVEQAGRNAKTPVRLWLRLLACSNLLEGEIRRRLKSAHGISLARFDFLAQLYRSPQGCMTMGELGRCLMVTGGNITGLTDRLEREGWVRRKPNPADRRSQVIALTQEGRRAFEVMAGEHEDWVREIVSGLSPAEQRQAFELLGTLKTSIRNAGDGRT